jgi:hypothetical protein
MTCPISLANFQFSVNKMSLDDNGSTFRLFENLSKKELPNYAYDEMDYLSKWCTNYIATKLF